MFPNEGILNKEETKSWKSYANSLHPDNRELFTNMLNDCHKYTAAAINATGQAFPAESLRMVLLLLSQHKMIDWLGELVSRHESTNKEVNQSKQQREEQRMKEFIILTMIICKEDYSVYMNSIAAVDEDFFEGV
jgi:hypothetical protein